MRCVFTILFLVLAVSSSQGGTCPVPSGPEAAVKGYLTAMQKLRFDDAYKFVTENMTDGKSMKEWGLLQQYFYLGGEVIIFGISVRNAISTEGDPQCISVATVPNVLKSRDKFNNQGTTEFELYWVIKDGEGWKVDSLEVLFDKKRIESWFPGDHIPEFWDQHPSSDY